MEVAPVRGLDSKLEGVVAHTFNPSMWEAKAVPDLCEFEPSLKHSSKSLS